MKKNEAISILATSVRPREQKDRARYDEAVKMAVNALNEPESKTGKWERHNTDHGDDVSGFVDPDWRCSECGRQANVNAWCMYDLTDFCPNCGARMVQEGEDNDG